MTITTRFAPSPTGPLHLGHAYSALLAFDLARAQAGSFLLRIEDIDRSRARPEWETQIYDDLHWLGIDWQEPVMRQSDRLEIYSTAIQGLWDAGLLFACDCKRRDILEAASAPQEGGSPVVGPDGVVYPGTCRTKGLKFGEGALRLNMHKAVQMVEQSALQFVDDGRVVLFDKQDLLDSVGDIVLMRQDMGTSYHLSVVIDDAAQGVTLVSRGEDLREATKIHIVLQRLIDLPSPEYLHHKLIRDDAGKRLAKRDDARAIARYRSEGASAKDIRRLVGL